MKRSLLLVIALLGISSSAPPWGFYAHKKINRLAVFTLPAGMIRFYKANLDYVEAASVNPDKRRYVVEEEGPRHFLDVDHYPDTSLASLPRTWDGAVSLYGPDSLKEHGILPWHLYTMYIRLRNAFVIKDPSAILHLSAELGHYVGDAHVPLHTTRNYNGQLTGQEGIHGFWESRLPELFADEYDFFVGRAEYIEDPERLIWNIVLSSYRMVNRVLDHERELAGDFREKRFSFETRGNTTVRVYAKDYARAYHRVLDDMVERQMRASIKVTGDLWFSAWVDAGQPDLHELINYRPSDDERRQNEAELSQWKSSLGPRRHE